MEAYAWLARVMRMVSAARTVDNYEALTKGQQCWGEGLGCELPLPIPAVIQAEVSHRYVPDREHPEIAR